MSAIATATRPRVLAPFRWEGDHVAADVAGGHALFTTRRGGVSTGAFASLNLGLLTADDGANVDENRVRVRPPPARRATAPLRQAGPRHHRPPRDGAARPGPPARRRGRAGDCARGHPALVFVADCTPVVLTADGAVAALHVGWPRRRRDRA